MRFLALAFAFAAALAGLARAATLEERVLAALVELGAPADGAVSLVGRQPGADGDGFAFSDVAYDAATGRFSLVAATPTGARVKLAGRVEEGIDAPVLVRDLKSGEIAQAEDVTFVRLARSKAVRGVVTDAAEVIGFGAKRPLRAGAPLRAGDFERPIVVRKGDPVSMVYEAPGVSLVARGRAMENGALGQAIAVVNSQSHRQVEAVVVGAGAVSVSPPDGPAVN